MRLKKAKPTQAATSNTTLMSRTMQLALSDDPPMQRRSVGAYVDVQWTGRGVSAPLAAFPRTPVEQYWAGRAVLAETLIAARLERPNEPTQIRVVAEESRQNRTMAKHNRKLHKELNWIVTFFAVALVVYVATMVAGTFQQKSPAAHFTVPILSPFTSVVEHETGVIGTKVVVVFILAMSGLLYFELTGCRPTRR